MEHRSDKTFKIVKKEYLIMNTITLVSNVGGMMGLFVGFSFLGLFEDIMEVVTKLWARIKEKVQEASKSPNEMTQNAMLILKIKKQNNT